MSPSLPVFLLLLPPQFILSLLSFPPFLFPSLPYCFFSLLRSLSLPAISSSSVHPLSSLSLSHPLLIALVMSALKPFLRNDIGPHSRTFSEVSSEMFLTDEKHIGRIHERLKMCSYAAKVFSAVLPRMRILKLNARSRAPGFAYIHAPPAPYKGTQP